MDCYSVLGYGGDGHGIFTLYQGKLTLWGGHGNYRQGLSLRAPTQPDYAMIAPGHWNLGAVRRDGAIDVYGNRNTFYNARPQKKDGTYWWMQTGNDFGCAMNQDNKLFCFGSNHSDVVGGKYAGDDIAHYGCGGYFCCAVKEDGNIVCWGRNNEGQRNVKDNGGYVEVYTGHHWTAALKEDRTPRCWGQNHGNPVGACKTNMKFKFLSLGGYHACGMLEDGDAPPANNLVCWGYDNHAEVRNKPNGRFVSLVCQHHGSCAINEETYKPFCWGLDNGNYFPNGGDKTAFYNAEFPCSLEGGQI